MLEEVVESKSVEFARRLGWKCYKWTSPGNRGLHDHLFFKNGVAFSIEFKAPGKKASALQRKVAEELVESGIPTRCIDHIYKAKEFIIEMNNMAEEAGPRFGDKFTFEQNLGTFYK
jgi:hypothetical protein